MNWKISKEGAEIIEKIAARAVEMAGKLGVPYTMMTATMDLTACHLNGNPLKLADLLAADDSNFAHDVFGIRRHINRQTGKLEGFFRPRYSA
jgi:hypothetical protein